MNKMFYEILLYAIPLLIINIYWYYHRKFQYFKQLGIPGPEPALFFGNVFARFSKSRAEFDLELGQKFGKIFGWFMGTTPVLEIQDVDLIKQICVKDFHLFNNRNKLRLYHEYWNNNLFAAEDDSWRRQRTITSPTFTSGKLRDMHFMMDGCAQKLVNYFNQMTQNGPIIFKTKQVSAGFTIDVIATTSFGTDTNANGEDGEKSPFLINSLKFFNVNPLFAFFSNIAPLFIVKLLNIKTIFNVDGFNFLISYTRELIKRRRSSSQNVKHDLIQLMMNASADEGELEKKNYHNLTADADSNEDIREGVDEPKIKSSNRKQVKLTEDELIATSIIFFSAGFETTATTIAHSFLELAKNPEVQEKLYNEVEKVLKNYPEKNAEYFEVLINKISYLDAVVKETLRMYPPLVALLRRCSVDGYKLNGIPIQKDMTIGISTYAVHHNPEYWPEPERYNPERFLPGNEHLCGSQYAFIPFGAGPRNCIGMRFALVELKICLGQIVRHFRFERAPGTPDKPSFAPGSLLLNPKEFPLIVSKR